MGKRDYGGVDHRAPQRLAVGLLAPPGSGASRNIGGVDDPFDVVPPQRNGRSGGESIGGGLARQAVKPPVGFQTAGRVGAGNAAIVDFMPLI
jgi:hypothetical protein